MITSILYKKNCLIVKDSLHPIKKNQEALGSMSEKKKNYIDLENSTSYVK